LLSFKIPLGRRLHAHPGQKQRSLMKGNLEAVENYYDDHQFSNLPDDYKTLFSRNSTMVVPLQGSLTFP